MTPSTDFRGVVFVVAIDVLVAVALLCVWGGGDNVGVRVVVDESRSTRGCGGCREVVVWVVALAVIVG